MIQVLNLDNKKDVLELWKENRGVLSIPFNKEIDEILLSESFFGIYENNKLIAMGGYKIMKRKPEARIIHLCTKKEFRHQGYASKLICFICDKIKEMNLSVPLVIYYKKGAENNSFWERFVQEDKEIIQNKTICTYRAIIDFSKIIK